MGTEVILYDGSNAPEDWDGGAMLTSYDRREREQAIALFAAVQGSDASLDEMVGDVIRVKHVVMHSAPLVDRETGEVTQTVRCVLIDPDGLRYSTRSDTVKHDIARAAHLFMAELPWVPALHFKVVQVKNRAKDRSYLQLVPVLAEW